jgi:hypothetical protein
VHHGGEDVVLPANLLYSKAVDILVELFGVLISSVAVKVFGVDVKYELVHNLGIRFVIQGANGSLHHHAVKGREVCTLAGFVVDVEIGAAHVNIAVAVAFVFPLVVPVKAVHLVPGVALIFDKGIIYLDKNSSFG